MPEASWKFSVRVFLLITSEQVVHTERKFVTVGTMCCVIIVITWNSIHIIPLSGVFFLNEFWGFFSTNSHGNRNGPKLKFLLSSAVETRCSFGIIYKWLVVCLFFVCFFQNILLNAFIMLQHYPTSYYEINFILHSED